MFQPYLVIVRLAHKKENKYRVVFRIEISMIYRSIGIRHKYIKLDSLTNKEDGSCNVLVFKIVKRLAKNTIQFYFMC
jgi:hypothetical protein